MGGGAGGKGKYDGNLPLGGGAAASADELCGFGGSWDVIHF
jgi:hypothetical protein